MNLEGLSVSWSTRTPRDKACSEIWPNLYLQTFWAFFWHEMSEWMSVRSKWCEALSFVLLFCGRFGLIFGLFIVFRGSFCSEMIWFLQSELCLSYDLMNMWAFPISGWCKYDFGMSFGFQKHSQTLKQSMFSGPGKSLLWDIVSFLSSWDKSLNEFLK